MKTSHTEGTDWNNSSCVTWQTENVKSSFCHEVTPTQNQSTQLDLRNLNHPLIIMKWKKHYQISQHRKTSPVQTQRLSQSFNKYQTQKTWKGLNIVLLPTFTWSHLWSRITSTGEMCTGSQTQTSLTITTGTAEMFRGPAPVERSL